MPSKLWGIVPLLFGMLLPSVEAAAVDPPQTGNRDTPEIFSPRRGHTAEVFQNRIWVLAGRDESTRLSDVWSSPDGTHWVEETASAAFPARSGHGSAVMNGRLWIFGGQDSDGEPMNDVWSSANGVAWEQEASSAEFPPRFNHAVALFDGRLWIIGGVGDAGRLNDVWSSADGTTWEMATEAAPFSPRGIHEAVGFAGRLWVLGGAAQDLPYNRDVWSSADGVEWREEDTSPVFSGRGGHSAVVLNDRLWVIAGASGPVMPFFPLQDVWSSSDGISWELTNSQAPFNIRSQHASVVFNGRMWVIGGFQGGTRYGIWLYNDVWSSADGVAWDRAVPLVPAVPAWIAHPATSETGTIVVEWAESEFADSYELQRSRDAGPWVNVYTGPDTESQDSVGHGRYRYRVRACSVGVCSDWRTSTTELDVPFNFRDFIEFTYLTALDREPETGAVNLWDAGYFHYFFVQGGLGIRLMPQDVGSPTCQSPLRHLA